MDIFKLYRNFWDFCFENPEKIKPNDIAIFSFAIEHCNRLGWKKKFGFPTSMVMDATGIKSYSVYKKHLDNLVSCGFILMIEYSKNQYSSNIIALEENNKAQYKALDKAFIKHSTKQSESTIQSTVQSIDSIDKQIHNSTNLPNNFLLEKETKEENLSKENPIEIFPQSESVEPGAEERKKVAPKKERFKPPTVQEVQDYCNERQNGIQAYTFVNFYQSKGWKVGNQPMKDWKAAIRTWEQTNKQNGITNTTNTGFSNKGSVSNGKIQGRSIVADRISQHLARNSESGNHTIDIEANIVR